VARYEIPMTIVERDGPFEEFHKNGAMVSVELADGRIIGQVLLIYPNEVWAVQDHDSMPFDTDQVVKVFQSPEDRRTHSRSDWTFFGAPDAT